MPRRIDQEWFDVINRKDSWEELERDWSECNRCSLSADRERVLIGGGNQQGHVLVIGQYPGYEEAKKGTPFIGKLGKKVREFLRTIAPAGHFYYTNILACRAQRFGRQNPALLKEYVEPCLMRVDAIVRLLRPRLIIAVGTKTAAVMYGGKLTGQEILEYKGIPVVCLDFTLFIIEHANWMVKKKQRENLAAEKERLKTIYGRITDAHERG